MFFERQDPETWYPTPHTQEHIDSINSHRHDRVTKAVSTQDAYNLHGYFTFIMAQVVRHVVDNADSFTELCVKGAQNVLQVMDDFSESVKRDEEAYEAYQEATDELRDELDKKWLEVANKEEAYQSTLVAKALILFLEEVLPNLPHTENYEMVIVPRPDGIATEDFEFIGSHVLAIFENGISKFRGYFDGEIFSYPPKGFYPVEWDEKSDSKIAIKNWQECLNKFLSIVQECAQEQKTLNELEKKIVSYTVQHLWI